VRAVTSPGSLRHLATTSIAVTLVFLALASAGGADTSRTASTITSVAFAKGSKAPRIIVTGHDFGARPSYDPSYQPEGHQGCPPQSAKTDGHDYGTTLWLYDTKASHGNTAVWRAGRYAGAQELDCIGLIIDSWSASRVVIHFGSQYNRPSTSAAPSTYVLSTGDPFVLRVKNATFRGTVRF
jgi:hypothetical protein